MKNKCNETEISIYVKFKKTFLFYLVSFSPPYVSSVLTMKKIRFWQLAGKNEFLLFMQFYYRLAI